MADYETQLAIDQRERAIRRDAHPTHRPVQQPVHVAKFEYQLAGTEANTETIRLGSLGIEGAVIVPEASSVWVTGTGDGAMSLTLRKEDGAVALTAAAAVNNNRAAFARPTALTVPALGAEDNIEALLSSVTENDATKTLHVEIAYRSAHSSY